MASDDFLDLGLGERVLLLPWHSYGRLNDVPPLQLERVKIIDLDACRR